MAYDCINGWEDMIEALRLDLSAEGIDGDDAQEVATLALDRIAQLQATETAARAMLAALKAVSLSEADTSFAARCYRKKIKDAIATAEAAGITTVEG